MKGNGKISKGIVQKWLDLRWHRIGSTAKATERLAMVEQRLRRSGVDTIGLAGAKLCSDEQGEGIAETAAMRQAKA